MGIKFRFKCQTSSACCLFNQILYIRHLDWSPFTSPMLISIPTPCSQGTFVVGFPQFLSFSKWESFLSKLKLFFWLWQNWLKVSCVAKTSKNPLKAKIFFNNHSNRTTAQLQNIPIYNPYSLWKCKKQKIIIHMLM